MTRRRDALPIHHGNDAVGEWVFWDPVGERSRADAFEWTLVQAKSALMLLCEARLLAADLAVATFAPADRRGPFGRQISPSDPIGDVQRLFQSEWVGLFPLSLFFEGEGVLLSANGETRNRNLVTVSASEVAHHGRVLIATRCDAWLPYDLRGGAQPETSALNAPRLRQVLERMEGVLGVAGECRRSEIASCNGYSLANRLDVDGEPLDVFDLGYDESRIATE